MATERERGGTQTKMQPGEPTPVPSEPGAERDKPGLHGRPAVMLAVSVAAAASCVLCGYEMLRTTSNTLFVAAYGKQGLPWILALVPIGVSLVIVGYGRLLSWLGPRKTLHVSTVLAILTMGLCYLAIAAGNKPARGVLYVFKESYVVLLIEQYWSYIDSMLSKHSAKRLNGPICGIASIGAVLGGWLLSLLSARWGTLTMVPLAGLATLPAVLLTEAAFHRCGEPRSSSRASSRPTSSDHLGLKLFRKNRMLVLLICLIGSAQLLGAVLELSFKGMLQDQMPDVDTQNAFSGRYYAWVNGIAMLGQFILAPVLLSLVQMRHIHLAIPMVHLGACAYLMAGPTLFRAGLALMIFKVLDYSVFRAAKELLYVPLSFDVRYRAKEIIDVLGYRVSKGVTSLGITLLQYAGVTFSVAVYALIGMAGAGAWLGLVWPISRYDRERAEQPS
jgi:AAA family ATP:ADP antiporter